MSEFSHDLGGVYAATQQFLERAGHLRVSPGFAFREFDGRHLLVDKGWFNFVVLLDAQSLCGALPVETAAVGIRLAETPQSQPSVAMGRLVLRHWPAHYQATPEMADGVDPRFVEGRVVMKYPSVYNNLQSTAVSVKKNRNGGYSQGWSGTDTRQTLDLRNLEPGHPNALTDAACQSWLQLISALQIKGIESFDITPTEWLDKFLEP